MLDISGMYCCEIAFLTSPWDVLIVKITLRHPWDVLIVNMNLRHPWDVDALFIVKINEVPGM